MNVPTGTCFLVLASSHISACVQAPELSADEVKELVKVQLKSGKPVRAPWYRGEAVANATLKLSPSPELRSSITGPSPAPASTAGGKSPTPKGTGFFCPM